MRRRRKPNSRDRDGTEAASQLSLPPQDSKSNIERILNLNSKPLFFFHVFSCQSINPCGFEATDSALFDRAFWLGMVDHWPDLFYLFEGCNPCGFFKGQFT